MPGWRLRSRSVIRQAIAANPDAELTAMIKAIDDAYPFGERRYAPYKEWLDERAKAISAMATLPIHRICKACGARPFRPCRNISDGTRKADLHMSRRLLPEDSGPLFGKPGAIE